MINQIVTDRRNSDNPFKNTDFMNYATPLDGRFDQQNFSKPVDYELE